jgi:hypothetical protein
MHVQFIGWSLRQGWKILMPIRIKHSDKPRDRLQPAKDKVLSALLDGGSMAYYAGRNPKTHILCGSV